MEVEKNKLKRNPEDTRRRILDVSLKLFALNGYEKTTTREICDLAKVNINLIYYYFGGKEGLYATIVNELIEKQTAFVGDEIDYDIDLEKLEYKEKVEILTVLANKMVDFCYNFISKEQISFFLQFQQNPRVSVSLPAHLFFSRLLSSIINKKPDSREVVFALLFLMSQITMPRLVPLFSLRVLGRDDFDAEDIKMIKENINNYIKMIYLDEKRPK